jgi:TRAP-type mannitol/chloroaromatic compound transport system substrate-binding protein
MMFSKILSELTDGKFQVQIFAAGEIVPGFQVADAVQNRTVEMTHTAAYYNIGKDPTFALATAMPFGMNTRQQNAWMTNGGGQQLINDFLAKFNLYGIPLGNTTAQMGGWFRKEIKTVDDLKGLKFRVAGMAGQILARLGVVPQQIPGGDIYPALERGTIDAAEWVGPYDDEKLGFVKVAPYYYYPGWWEGGAVLHLFVNAQAWSELPASYKAAVSAAAAEAGDWTTGRYDAQNPGAIRRLIGQGAQLRPFSTEIMDACLAISNTLMAEISASNADFKKIYDQYTSFKNDQYLWHQIGEYGYDTYMIRSRNKR